MNPANPTADARATVQSQDRAGGPGLRPSLVVVFGKRIQRPVLLEHSRAETTALAPITRI
jgi:hypothetical protein